MCVLGGKMGYYYDYDHDDDEFILYSAVGNVETTGLSSSSLLFSIAPVPKWTLFACFKFVFLLEGRPSEALAVVWCF